MRLKTLLFRKDRIRNWIYPELKRAQILDRILRGLIHKRVWLTLLIIAVIGWAIPWLLLALVLVKPHAVPANTPGPFDSISDISAMMTLSSVMALLAAFGYLLFRYINNRPRHIIQPFSPGKETPELKAFASKATAMFTDHIRNIDGLLNLRQVENVSNRSDNLMAVVITSGQDQEQNKEFTSSVNIEASGIKLSLDRFLSFITFNMAKTRIQGKVQERQDGGLEVSIEIIKKNNHTFTASRVIAVDDSTGFVRDSVLTGELKELAIEVVMKLGKGNRLASSWENLRDFLGGLEASAQRNWWHAIALYRHAIQREESARGEFGLGHHHLGSILVSQGEPRAGLKHLKIAEVSGFPLPDTQYMIALTLFYIHQNDLHKKKSSPTSNADLVSQSGELSKIGELFNEIILHCERALVSRRNFAEAYHLLGAVYYQVGKLLDREDNKAAPASYHNAIKNLQLATEHYGKKIDQITGENQTQYNNITVEKERLIKNYITATNRLAASLRSLGKFSDAEKYYLGILNASPASIQTLADLAKTYCLAEQWNKAENLFKKKVFYLDDAVWNIDVNFYRGWALAGQIRNMQFSTSNPPHIFGGSASSDGHPLNQFGKALQYLDYALYQRPRFISSWRQTRWETQFKAVAERLRKEYAKEINHPIDYSSNECSLNYGANWVFYVDHWLWWRIDGFKDDLNGPDENKTRLLELAVYPDRYPFPALGEAYRELKSLRNKLKKLLQSIDDAGNIGGVRNHWIRLTWAQQSYRTWEKVHELLNPRDSVSDIFPAKNVSVDARSETKPVEVTFGQRWAIDVYAEIAMLACRLLAECRAYEHLYTIANQTSKTLDDWLRFWQSNYKTTDEDFRFSARVLGHQIASCYSWKAYALLQQNKNPETSIRIHAPKKLRQNDLERCQEAIKNAFEHRKLHPLTIYVQAQIYRANKLHRLAIGELTHLLLLVEPFDPKTFYSNTEERLASRNLRESNELRRHYYYMERVSGLQQFDDFIDRTRIHVELAELFALEDDYKSSVDHYLMALTSSPYKDIDAKNLLKLSTQLYRLNRFDEAFSVIQEIHVRCRDMSTSSAAVTKGQEAEIMECILYTRLDDFYSALEKGLALSKALTKPFFNDLKNLFSHLNHQNELDQYFKKAGYSDEELVILNPERGLSACFNDATRLIENQLDDATEEKRLNDTVSYLKQIAGGIFPTPDEPLLRAALLLKITNMSKLLESHFPASNQNNLSSDSEKYRVMLSHLLQFTCKKALDILIQEAEIANNIAYNEAELHIDLAKAEQRSRYAIAVFEFIADCVSDQDNRLFINHAKDKTAEIKNAYGELFVKQADTIDDSHFRIKALKAEKNYREKYGEVISGQEIAEKLALYYDTLGWIYYRKGGKRDYERAQEHLETALLYNANIMLSHYHLARILLTLFEQLWQANNKTNTVFNAKAKRISRYLREAFYHLNTAQELKGIKRIESKILRLKGRIQTYREHWDRVQLTYDKEISKQSEMGNGAV